MHEALEPETEQGCCQQVFSRNFCVTDTGTDFCARLGRAGPAAAPLAPVPVAWHCEPSRQLGAGRPSGHEHSCQLPLLDTCNKLCNLQDVPPGSIAILAARLLHLSTGVELPEQ